MVALAVSLTAQPDLQVPGVQHKVTCSGLLSSEGQERPCISESRSGSLAIARAETGQDG